MSRPPANKPIPNPAYICVGPKRPQNDQETDQKVSVFEALDPKAPVTIDRRLGTRYGAA